METDDTKNTTNLPPTLKPSIVLNAIRMKHATMKKKLREKQNTQQRGEKKTREEQRKRP